eukprot:12418905-Karenia_brevis.AAC.1
MTFRMEMTINPISDTQSSRPTCCDLEMIRALVLLLGRGRHVAKKLNRQPRPRTMVLSRQSVP